MYANEAGRIASVRFDLLFFFGNKLKDKEKIMLDAIDGNLLVPEYPDDYLQEVKKIY
ncbi:hypothetical protein [Lactiplantibacillus pentosus]|uniref:hypothetical protein n=1 Tax=Lactiplantibacillus pentosus TaxID=1589 RepID=UPI001CFFBC05|nr:hypothetical protein [Lactiplantibacillus pentosus]MCB5223348.1 hypothetical protein [Lactiplantibacillus pentosus]